MMMQALPCNQMPLEGVTVDNEETVADVCNVSTTRVAGGTLLSRSKLTSTMSLTLTGGGGGGDAEASDSETCDSRAGLGGADICQP